CLMARGPINAKGLDGFWACGTTRSLSLNLKKCQGDSRSLFDKILK
ncbi:LOW QUALITY PROTEIN: uncharacterized protein LOC117898723, partial [Drosophila subobscura]